MKGIISFVVVACIVTFSYSQTITLEVISATGETYNNTVYQLDWSLGEVLTDTYTGSKEMLTQGFHQGKYIITAVDQFNSFPFEITAFPNPVTNYVILNIGGNEFNRLQYSLADINGKMIQISQVSDKQQQINLQGMTVGTYFLNVFSENKIVKSFKIQKSN
jgi:hypothetical protein